MIYRPLGNTGLSVSEIGLGCEGFLKKSKSEADRMFSLALESGVNCMDMYSPDPELHSLVGRVISENRSSFVLQAHFCTTWQDGQYKAVREISSVRSSFEKMIGALGTGHVDVGMIHYVDSEKTWSQICEGGIMDYAIECKRKGIISHIGMSSHNPLVALEAVKSGLIEVLMFSVNPCYDMLAPDDDVEKLFQENSYSGTLNGVDPARRALYDACLESGVGITVMKVFGGGDLLSDNSPAGKAMTVPQCIHYALTRPAVSSVLVGAHSPEELRAALDYENSTDEEKDYTSAFAGFRKNMSWSGHCMYCGHCAPCPRGIDIASLMKFLSLSRANRAVPETVREHYASLSSFASDCIGCGACQSRCPFGVDVISAMREAKEMFGH